MAYDEVIDQVSCPACATAFELRTQIKFGYCRGHQLRRGDTVLWCDPPGRPAPLIDYEMNSGGEIVVPGAGDDACPSCGIRLPNAVVHIRDNVIAGVTLSPESGDEVVQLSPPARWFNCWSIRRAGSRNEDRLQVYCRGTCWTIAVADGAGGTGGGAAAASVAVDSAAAFGSDGLRTAAEWCAFLRLLDHRLEVDRRAGETTLVVVQVVDGTVRGASVGDSRAWMVDAGELVDLTELQHRKPLLGTGGAAPVAFGPHTLLGRLLVGTDGLFSYVPPNDVVAAALHAPLKEAASLLVDRARLPTGGLQDDIALVIGEWAGQLGR